MKKLGISWKSLLLYILTFVVIVGGDQYTKYLVDSLLHLGTSYTIIDNFFSLTYVQNNGAAWGILQGNMNLFYVISAVAAVIIVYYFITSKPYQTLTRYGLVLVFSGMVGNLIDRVLLGYVRDFLDFLIIGYNYPVFNIADSAITIGVIFLIVDIVVEEYKTWKLKKSQ